MKKCDFLIRPFKFLKKAPKKAKKSQESKEMPNPACKNSYFSTKSTRSFKNANFNATFQKFVKRPQKRKEKEGEKQEMPNPANKNGEHHLLLPPYHWVEEHILKLKFSFIFIWLTDYYFIIFNFYSQRPDFYWAPRPSAGAQ